MRDYDSLRSCASFVHRACALSGDYAAIKACFAPGPMFASVPGLFALVWGGWGAGR